MQRTGTVFWFLLMFAAGAPLAPGMEDDPAAERCTAEHTGIDLTSAPDAEAPDWACRFGAERSSSKQIRSHKTHHSCERHAPVAAEAIAFFSQKRDPHDLPVPSSICELDVPEHQRISFPAGTGTAGSPSPPLYLLKMVFRL
jgi:hypothetical protein